MLHIVRLFNFLVACAEDGLYIVGGEGFVASAEDGRVRYLRQHLLCGTYLTQGGGNAQLAEERLQTVYSRQHDLLLVPSSLLFALFYAPHLLCKADKARQTVAVDMPIVSGRDNRQSDAVGAVGVGA